MSQNMQKSSLSRGTSGAPSDAGLIENVEPIRHHHGLERIVSEIDYEDAKSRYEVEAQDNKIHSPNSSTSSVTTPHKTVISWEDGDPECPYNWSTRRKVWIVLIGMVIVINSTMGSSLPSNAIPFIADHFHITSSYSKVLPISMYLVGYIVGPLAFGPLSESFGRQIIMISTFAFFTIFTIACAVAPNWAALLVFRFLAGVCASSPIAVIGGLYADIYGDPVTRGRAMAVFVGGTCVGPLVAPLISGFIAPGHGWRWCFWIGTIFAGASWIPMIFLPETFGPVLLARRAAKMRKTTGNAQIFAPIELEKKGFKQMVTVTLTRPIRMLCFELIVLASCLYLSVAYGVFYMFFEAYNLIFQGIYHKSPGVAGCMFLLIAVGACIATGGVLYYDTYLRRAQALHKPWTQKEEFRRLPLACVGGPCFVIALFWLGWTARESVPYWVPMLAGIPSGIGFILIFGALLNYLADAYEIFAASAMAAASCCRSLAGALLPLAATPMYNKLGVAWASSLLGFLSLGMCAIPFVFLWKGDIIREKSTFCRYLKERKQKELEELELQRQRQRERQGLARESTEAVDRVVEEKV